MNLADFNNFFGDMDLYLLDQVLKGSFENKEKVLDVGSGQGRNLLYFLLHGFDVHAIDRDKSNVQLCRFMAQKLNYHRTEQIIRADLSQLPYSENKFDAVICSRVLHFAKSEEEYLAYWEELHRILKPGALLYIATDSIIGFTDKIEMLPDNRVVFPDGSIRFPLTEELLSALHLHRNYRYLEPIKTILHGKQHAQSVLVLSKKI